MTSITIQPITTENGGVAYLATSNGKRSEGATAGEAIDALAKHLPLGSLLIVPDHRPDQFFSADQQRRLAELLDRRRACRAEGKTLSNNDQQELIHLVEAELHGAAARSAALADELGQ